MNILLVQYRRTNSRCHSFGSSNWRWSIKLKILVLSFIIYSFFSFDTNLRHYCHSLEGIVSICTLSWKHYTICSIKNCICDIWSLRSCGSWSLDHRFKHLRGSYNWFCHDICLFNHPFLSNKYFFWRNFHPQISSRYHYSIRSS